MTTPLPAPPPSGLDYWPYVCVNVHKSWEDFYQHFSSLEGPTRLVAYTVYGSSYYGGPEFTYRPGDWLVYGAETTGLPEQAHVDVLGSGGALVKIPINTTHVRSLNLAVSVGIGVFEALRQLDSEHVVQPRDDSQLPQNQPYRPQAVLQDSGAAAAGQQ
jgi:tRNA (cytidine/uridine-2'-O-)-methyltransferase